MWTPAPHRRTQCPQTFTAVLFYPQTSPSPLNKLSVSVFCEAAK